MRLKNVKLAGFKTFVDPTTINFPSNLGAVVGPNGCGKSNVIDAIGRQPCQVDDRPYGSVRFSFDRAIDDAQLESAVEISSEVFQRLAGLTPNANWPLSAEV